MEDSLRISAIVPTRGRPAMLAEAVASVLAQTRPADEVLVVDDGDGGLDSAPIEGGRVRVLRGPGRGPGAARNVGLQAATGELIAFLDDDDLWAPEKLEVQVRWFEARPALGVLGTRCVQQQATEATRACGGLRRQATEATRACGGLRQQATEATRACGALRQQATEATRRRLRRVGRRSLLRRNGLVMSSVLARRECVLEAGGFDEGLPLAQDWDLWLRVEGRWEMEVVQEELTFYRRHGEQRSGDRAQMRRWEGEVVRRALARDGLGKRARGVGRRRLAWCHARLGRLLLRKREIREARSELRESMELFPFNPVVWGALARCVFARLAAAEAE